MFGKNKMPGAAGI